MVSIATRFYTRWSTKLTNPARPDTVVGVAANYPFLASLLFASAVLLAAISLGLAITTGYFRRVGIRYVLLEGASLIASALPLLKELFTGRQVHLFQVASK